MCRSVMSDEFCCDCGALCGSGSFQNHVQNSGGGGVHLTESSN